jgi:hypothetical protein
MFLYRMNGYKSLQSFNYCGLPHGVKQFPQQGSLEMSHCPVWIVDRKTSTSAQLLHPILTLSPLLHIPSPQRQ